VHGNRLASMVEAIACFFLISFPLAVWAFFVVAKRIYQHRPDDASFLGRLLSTPPVPRPVASRPEESRAEPE
jgi:hypothetical protein